MRVAASQLDDEGRAARHEEADVGGSAGAERDQARGPTRVTVRSPPRR